MKIKKTLILGGILLVSNGYCGLKYEAELAKKFCPSLQLHLGDQGVSPKPIHIMSNKEEEKVYRLKTDTSLESIVNSEQPKKTKKGRIIGTLIGAGIGGGLGYWVYKFSYDPELKEHKNDPVLTTAVSAIGGGMIGYQIEGSKKRKGKIIGTIIGIGIGGAIGVVFYVASGFSFGLPREPSSLALIVPIAIGGMIGCDIGDRYDKKTLNKEVQDED